MKSLLGSVSTVALALCLATGLAVAQDKQERRSPEQQRSGSGAERSSGGRDGASAPARGQQQDRGRGAGSSERSGAARGQSSGAEGRAAPRGADKADRSERGNASARERPATDRKDQPKRASEPKAKDNQKRASDQKGQDNRKRTAEPKAKAKDNQSRADDRKAQDNQKRTAEPKAKAKDNQNRADDQKAQDNQKRTAEPKGKDDQNRAEQNRQGAPRGERVDISPEQRDRVRSAFREQKLRRSSNINVNIEIGRRLPRNVTLYSLPPRIIDIVPRYRSYRYIYVEDHIAIVDPATYEIVYVVDDRPGGSGGGVRAAAFDLTSTERAFLLDLIDNESYRASFSFRLALGADVPDRIDLHRFPDRIVDRVPKLERYRFVVVDHSLLIVDPGDRQIELVVERR